MSFRGPPQGAVSSRPSPAVQDAPVPSRHPGSAPVSRITLSPALINWVLFFCPRLSRLAKTVHAPAMKPTQSDYNGGISGRSAHLGHVSDSGLFNLSAAQAGLAKSPRSMRGNPRACPLRTVPTALIDLSQQSLCPWGLDLKNTIKGCQSIFLKAPLVPSQTLVDTPSHP